MNRNLGANERLYWLFNHWSANNVLAIAELAGELEPARLERALARLQASHPFLQCRVLADARGHHPRFVRRGTGPLPLRISAAGSLDLELMRELNDRLEPERVLARACYVRHDGRSAVILTCLHIVADATAAMLALRDLLEAYDRLSSEDPRELARPALPGIDRLLPARQTGVRGLPLTLRGQWLALRDQLRDRPARMPLEVNLRIGRRQNRLIRRQLSSQRTEALKQECEARGVTVHGLLMAALGVALARELRLRDRARALLNVGAPVSLRSELDPPRPEDLGSYVCTLNVHLDVGHRQDLWSIARQANRELKRRRARSEHVAMLNMVEWVTPASFAQSARTVSLIERNGPGNVCLSNIGTFAFPDEVAGIGVESAHWTASLSITGYLLCAVCTTHGRLQLDFSYLEGVVSEPRAARIVNHTLAELGDIAEACA